MPARRDTRIEASRLRRLSPLQTLEDQSQVWGICCHSCTWRERLTLSWKLSYKIHILRSTRGFDSSFDQRIARYSRWTDHSIHLCFKTPHATFAARGSSVMCPLSWASRERELPARPTCDLTVHASPWRDIASSRQGAGSSAYAAL